MSNTINFYKVTKDENSENTLTAVTVAGIAQDGIVLDAGGLNNEIADACQWFIYKGIESKHAKAVTAYNKAVNAVNVDAVAVAELKAVVDDYHERLEMLEPYTNNKSNYAFVNRIALAILNEKSFRIDGENALMDALRIKGLADNARLADLSETRKEVVAALDYIFEIKECPYIKPVMVKLNLKEVSQLVAIANNVKARWTDKGIKVRQSKTIATETALQAILFTCKNAFKMVIPIASGKDDRAVI